MAPAREMWTKKVNELKFLLEKEFPELDARNMHERMSKIGHYHYNKKGSMIFGLDKKLYNFLIKNSYNPYTVYRWLLLEKVPEDIRFQLNERQISQRKAIKLSMERKRETDPYQVLQLRLSHGEISTEEYTQMVETINQTQQIQW